MGTKVHTGDTNTLAFFNEHDISCAIYDGSFDHSREIANLRTLCGNDKLAGKHDSSASFSGYGIFAATAGEWDEEAWADMSAQGNDQYLVIFGEAGAAGDTGRHVAGLSDSQVRPWSVDGAAGLNGSLQGEAIARVVCLDRKDATTGTGANTGQNVGIVEAAKTFECLIIVSAETALTSMTVQIEESSDNGVGDAFAQLTGLTIEVGGDAADGGGDTVDFTGTGWARLTRTGTATEAYIRTNVTAFTGTSATMTSVAGEVAENDQE